MRAVIAFGGNAITRSDQRGTFGEQLTNIRSMSNALVGLISHGVQVVVTHGNGPQVGQIAVQQDIGLEMANIPPMPFDAAGAMSEGLIGYMLQQTLTNALRTRNLPSTCVTLITQVVVAADDAAFKNPTKPVGRFYTKDQAEALAAEKGWSVVEDAGRGYRRVVPSPQPLAIVEWPAISVLLTSGALVVAAGGGGIPVVEETGPQGTELKGVEAVIDKDRASARLAALVEADALVLLTDVDRVAVGFGTSEERWLSRVTLGEMRQHYQKGEFPPGSMGPKVESAIRFLENGGRRAIITSPTNLVAAVTGHEGTQVTAVGQAELPNVPSETKTARRDNAHG